LAKTIRLFKYEDLRVLAGPLGKLMARGWTVLKPPATDFDVIVPIPLHPSRQRKRGYNQALLLARELGRRLEKPVEEKSLVRTRHTRPQVDLDASARYANVKGAFRCTGGSLAGKRVLLVDDVFTSGATLRAATAALREGGVSAIWAYTLARAKGEGSQV
jgi:ComF family protein